MIYISNMIYLYASPNNRGAISSGRSAIHSLRDSSPYEYIGNQSRHIPEPRYRQIHRPEKSKTSAVLSVDAKARRSSSLGSHATCEQYATRCSRKTLSGVHCCGMLCGGGTNKRPALSISRVIKRTTGQGLLSTVETERDEIIIQNTISQRNKLKVP